MLFLKLTLEMKMVTLHKRKETKTRIQKQQRQLKRETTTRRGNAPCPHASTLLLTHLLKHHPADSLDTKTA